MKREAVSLEQRESDLMIAEHNATRLAAAWLERRAGGVRDDLALDEALRELRAADRRLVKTRKRLGR